MILHIWCHLSLLRPRLCSRETLQLCIISWCPPQAEGQRMALTEQRVGIADTGSSAHVTKTSGRGTKRIFSLSNGSKPWYNSALQLLTWCCFSCTPLLFSLGGNGAFRQSCNPIRLDLYWPWCADISFLFSPFLLCSFLPRCSCFLLKYGGPIDPIPLSVAINFTLIMKSDLDSLLLLITHVKR